LARLMHGHRQACPETKLQPYIGVGKPRNRQVA
jgi:hypothetical protein